MTLGDILNEARIQLLQDMHEAMLNKRFVEVWAICSVAEDGSWIIHETHSKDMDSKESRLQQVDWCKKYGERVSLIRARVLKPEPIHEAIGHTEE